MTPLIQELRKQSYILFTLARLKQKAKVRGTRLGYLWWFIEPAMLIALYSYLVTVIFERAGADAIPSIAAGVTFWKWWQTSVGQATKSVSGNKGMVSQVNIRIALLPMSAVFSQTYLFIYGLLLLETGLMIYGYYPDPVLLVLALLLSFGFISLLSGVLSGINVFVRETAYLIGFIMRMLFFVSPILYDRNRVPPDFQWVVTYNPFAQLIKVVKQALLGTEGFSIPVILLAIVLVYALLYLAIRKTNEIRSRIVLQL